MWWCLYPSVPPGRDLGLLDFGPGIVEAPRAHSQWVLQEQGPTAKRQIGPAARSLLEREAPVEQFSDTCRRRILEPSESCRYHDDECERCGHVGHAGEHRSNRGQEKDQ